MLTALYDGERRGGLGSSVPRVSCRLGGIWQYFPGEVVADVHLVATLFSLGRVMPAKATAREAVAIQENKLTDL